MGHAPELAERVLAGCGDRFAHSAAVARRAAELAVTVPEADRELLVPAAWLHDIGYASALARTGFHPLDGARHLDLLGWPARLCALVAHHSGARFVAAQLGLTAQLNSYPHEHTALSDALTYADQTVDTRGNRVTLRRRLADMLGRHGPDSTNARVHHLREPDIVAIATRVEHRLRGAPV
ncbi:HD domain-containing protein [Actinosynnema sp. NPDC020468]|uniref:HD domain-containing protein n=1 Tax=Actinosynnema sp. NPDC020468 TaxID=3154488 RepID=UPI0033EB1A21